MKQINTNEITKIAKQLNILLSEIEKSKFALILQTIYESPGSEIKNAMYQKVFSETVAEDMQNILNNQYCGEQFGLQMVEDVTRHLLDILGEDDAYNALYLENIEAAMRRAALDGHQLYDCYDLTPKTFCEGCGELIEVSKLVNNRCEYCNNKLFVANTDNKNN